MYMSSNTVLKKHFYFILGLLFLITGCATPLMNAAKSNDIKKMKNLLNEGADVNEEEFEGTTALSMSVSNGSIETARFLLDKGADINKGIDNGWGIETDPSRC